MHHSKSHTRLSTIRTGRAHVSMLDLIKVEVYGQKMPINQVATISTPESQLIDCSSLGCS